MIILTIRTDKPEAEIGLFDDIKQLGYQTWQAHRTLAETIHQQIEKLLNKYDIGLEDVGGIIVFQGPGSFTGLRIGISVANSLAYGLGIAIVCCKHENWLKEGIKMLISGQNDEVVTPAYGAPVRITTPKK